MLEPRMIWEIVLTKPVFLLASEFLMPNSPGTLQDLNGTLRDDTSVKRAQIKTFLCFIQFC